MLVRSCQDAFYRTAWAILRNDADAADAIQEAILRCWRSLGSLRNPAYFKTWATRIVVNESYAVARLRARTVLADELPDRPQSDPGFAQAEWQMLLGRLSERSRLVVALHYADGYKVAEVAQILDANENTVKGWLAVARREYEKLIAR